MSQLYVCYRHFAVQHVMARREVLSEPHHSADVMTVECAAQGFRRGGSRVLFFPPPLQFCQGLAVVQAVKVYLMHVRPRGFDSDDVRSSAQIAVELKSVVKEL